MLPEPAFTQSQSRRRSVVRLLGAKWHICRDSFIHEGLYSNKWHITERGSCVSHVWKSLEVEDSLSILAFS